MQYELDAVVGAVAGERVLKPYVHGAPARVTVTHDRAIDSLSLHIVDVNNGHAVLHLPASEWETLATAIIDFATSREEARQDGKVSRRIR